MSDTVLPQADEQLVEQVRGLLAATPPSFEDYQAGEGQIGRAHV